MGYSLRPREKAAISPEEKKSKQTGPNKPQPNSQTHLARRQPKAGQDNFGSASSIPLNSQSPTNPIAHSVSLKREGPQRAHWEGAGGLKGYATVCEKHEAGKRLGQPGQRLWKAGDHPSDLNNRAQTAAHLKGSP